MLLDAYLTPLVDDTMHQVTPNATIASQPQDTLNADFLMHNMNEDAGDTGQCFSPVHDTENQSDYWVDIWDVVLPLPSSYVHDILMKPSRSELISIEYNLCCIATNHALKDLRTALIGIRYLQLDKRLKQCKVHTMHAQGKIQATQCKANNAANEYH